MKPVAAYTLSSWKDRQAMLRLVAPWQIAGAGILHGTVFDKVDAEAISSAGLVHLHRDFPRLAQAYSTIQARARNAGIPVVYDYDEDLFELPIEHPDRQFNYISDALFPVLQAIVEANAVTVSTAALLSAIQPLNPQTWLLPTSLDDRLWSLKLPAARDNPAPLVFGWINDQLALPAGFAEGVERFLRSRGQTVLLKVWGARPPASLLALPNIDWMPELSPDYARFAAELNQQICDLFLVPHGDQLYYRRQSPLRFYEISVCGIPGIYSRVSPYRELVTSGENGWLAGDAGEWEAALEQLSGSASLRQAAAENAQQTTRQEGLLSRQVERWQQLYQQLTTRSESAAGQSPVTLQAARLADQVREWQRKLEMQIQERDWEVRALNLMVKRTERQASQHIEQLGSQLQAIWDSPAWRILHKGQRAVEIATGRKPRKMPVPEESPESQPAASPGGSQPAVLSPMPVDLPPARTFDIVYMAGTEWAAIPTRVRDLLARFAQAGGRIFFLAPAAQGEAAPRIQIIQERIFAVAPASQADDDDLDARGRFFEGLRLEAGIDDAICWVNDPTWADLAYRLRNLFAWKLVSSEAANRPVQERSDLVLTGPAMVEQFADIQHAFLELYPLASLIVLTYNNLGYTRQCLESIFSKTSYPNYEIVVVDNASTDGTLDYLRTLAETHSAVKLVLNPDNRGFSAGNNQGVQASAGNYMVFLNNDIIVTPGWLSRLIFHLRDPQVGAVGPVTNFAGNESRIAVDYRDIGGLDDFARRYTRAHDGQTFDIRMLALFCLVLRRAVIETVGPLDERFNIGMYEDDDFSLRLRQKGYRILCVEDVYIHHWGSASFSQLAAERYQRLHDENRAKFEEKWGTLWQPHRWRIDES